MLCHETSDTRQEDIERTSGSRDSFGSFLYLPMVEELDMKRVLAYPLTSVALIFAHIDGLKISTDKSTISSKLEVRIITDPPRNVDVLLSME